MGITKREEEGIGQIHKSAPTISLIMAKNINIIFDKIKRGFIIQYMNKIKNEFIDDLTVLYNRRYLFIKAPEELKKTAENKISESILFIDIDHFKNVNDTYGHRCGDKVLKEFAKFLKMQLRQDDIIFRYGGDEFICILPNTEYELAYSISQRFIQQCRIREFNRIRLTVSIGIASSPLNAKDWNLLFEIADRNLYSAKRHGRDQVGIFSEKIKRLNIPTKDIVGRDRELVRLGEFLESIFKGKGGAICISGEVGVGKTKFVQEIVKNIKFKGVKVIKSTLSPTTKSIPYYPFRELLRAALFKTIIGKEKDKDIFKLIPKAYQIELIKILPELSDTVIIDENISMIDKFRLFEGVRRLLTLKSSITPLFICLDNINWADEGSSELLYYLIRTLKNDSVFFFLIYRVEEMKGSYLQNILQLMGRERLYENIELEPLKISDVAQMLSFIVDDNLSFEFINHIFKETGGNPFFIEELIKSMEKNNALVWNSKKWIFDKDKKITIPSSIEGVVERKLNLIDADAQSLLEYTAIIGREFNFNFLQNITEMNEGHLFKLMDEIIEIGILRESTKENYLFSEDIIREIIYKKMSDIKLLHYHQIIGEGLLKFYENHIEEIVNELAYHFYLSKDYSKAIKYCMIVGDRAKNAYANQDAIRFYTQAIECLNEITADNKELNEAKCLRKRANVLSAIGENEKAIKDLNNAIKKAHKIKEMKEEADCSIELGEVYKMIACYSEAEKRFEKSLKIYKNLNDKKGEEISLINIGRVYYYIGKYYKAMDYYQKSLEINRKIGDHEREAMILNNIGIVYDNLSEYSKAMNFYQQSLKIYRKIGKRIGEASTLNDIGIYYRNISDFSKALAFYNDALKIYREIGDRRGEASILNNMGTIYIYLDKYNKALKYYKDSLDICKEMGNRNNESASLNNIGIIYDLLGEYSKAMDFYQRSLKVYKEIGEYKGEASVLSNTAAIYYKIGEYFKAMDYYQESLKIYKEIGDRRNEVESLEGIGDIYVEREMYTSAKRYYNKAYSIAKGIKSRLQQVDISLKFISLCLIKGDMIHIEKKLKNILSLADELSSKETRANVFNLLGQLYMKEKKWNKSKSYFGKSILIFKEIKSKFSIAKVYYYKGIMFNESEDKINAKKYFNKAIMIFEEIGSKGWIKKIRKYVS